MPRDEAAQAGKTPADFPETTVDYFHEVDGGVALTPDEAAGRNTWILWTGGNQAFWDYLANHSFGTLDLLKTADSRYRYRRFDYYGLMNDPDCTAATEPDEYGLYLDECPQPEGLDPEVYGRSAGVVGLRRFPNPNFDAAAEAAWDGERYYSDPEYYNNPELVRPYRLGMSCGFCHVSAHPLDPPEDPNAPEWRNISATIGGQYFWIGRIFTAHPDESNFIWQLLNSSPPGALDTSFVASDNINAPRTINAVFNVAARLEIGRGGAARGRRPQPAGRRAGDEGAAHPEGRLGFGRRRRRAQSRVHQHRHVPSGMGEPLQAAARWRSDADGRRQRAGKLGLLARHRRPGRQSRGLFPQGGGADVPRGRARAAPGI